MLRYMHMQACSSYTSVGTTPDPELSVEERIRGVLDGVRGGLQADGGDIEFIDFNVDTGVVRVRLLGACSACPMAHLTLRWGVEESLRLTVPEVTGVDPV